MHLMAHYEYKTAQIPANLISKDPSAASKALQSVIDENAHEGWEFYRVDSFSTALPGGCLSGGQPQQGTTYNVATFRRDVMG